MIDVVERNHFDGAVHVAIRDADERRGHAGAADLDRIGVGRRGAGRLPQLIGNLVFVGRVRPAARPPCGSCSGRDRRPAPGRGGCRPLASFRSLGSRWHGSRRWRCRRADRCCRCWSVPAQPDFFLHRGDGVGRDLQLVAIGPTQRLDDDPQPALVVHRGRDWPGR